MASTDIKFNEGHHYMAPTVDIYVHHKLKNLCVHLISSTHVKEQLQATKLGCLLFSFRILANI